MRRALFLLAIAVLAPVAWWAARSTATRPPIATARVPGIVLVVLDTLRHDAVAPSPGSAGLPRLRGFATTATSFADAVAPCSWTGPSVATLVTGLEPWAHGVFEMTEATRLSAAVPTLATWFGEAGWSTAALTGGGWLAEGAGIPTGFQSYRADFDEGDAGDAVARWASRRPLDRPFFLFLHTYAPHDPYGDKAAARAGRCPADASTEGAALAEALAAASAGGRDPFAPPSPPGLRARYVAARYADPCARAEAGRRLGRLQFDGLVDRCWPWLDGGWRDDPAGPSAVAAMQAAYFGPGLASVDERLRGILDAVAALPPDTVVVVVSDHGEAFGEHGPLYHARFLSPELVRVPLVVRAPGYPAGATVPGCCGLVDVAPTLLAIAGLPVPAALDGRSLAPLVRGGPGHPVASAVVPRAGLGGPGDRWVVRATVRDGALVWAGELDVRALAWAHETWHDRVADPTEQAPLPSPPAAAPALRAEVERVRTELLRLYLRVGVAGPR